MPKEKQTDVAIAVHLLSDAIDKAFDQAVIVSNDSDLAPAADAVKSRWPDLTVSVITPLLGDSRKLSTELRCIADWTRQNIRETELANAQLPDKVVTRKRLIEKPAHW